MAGEHGERPLLEISAEILLDACFESAPVGFGVLDEDLCWVRANRMLARLNGLPSVEHAGRPLAEVGGALAAGLEPHLRRALAGDPAVGLRVDLETDGGHRSVRASTFPLADEAGTRGVGVVVVDEHGDAELSLHVSLRLSEERLRLALEGTQTGTWEWARDADEIRWSANVGPLFGLPRGSAPPDYEEYVKLIHPADREPLQQAVRAAMQDGRDYRREFRALQPTGSYRWLSSRAHAVRDERGEVAYLVGLISDIHERRERELNAEFLARASDLLARSLDLETTLQQLADLAVPDLADWCAVQLGAADERLESVAVAHHDPAQLHWAREVQRRYPPDPGAPTGAAAVLRTGRSELWPELSDELIKRAAHDDDHAELLRSLGLRSTMTVPLRSGERTLGAMTFASSTSGRRYDEADLAFAEELGRRAALVIDNALVHRSESEALQRLQQLQAIADVGLSHLQLDDLLQELLRRITELTESPDAAILLLDETGRQLRVGAAVGLTEAARDEIVVPLGRGVAGTIASRRQSRLIDDLTQVEVHSDFLRRAARSLIGAPLLDEDEVIGVLRVTSPNPGAFTASDLQLLELVADRAARAISHARLYEQARSAALTLQRALLAGDPPELAGVRVASRYLPGQGGAEVGGDWYDVFGAADGRIVLVVGDMVGRGVRAAAVMGQLRNAVRAYAFEDPEPASVLGRLDRLIDSHVIEADFATACVCTVDLAARRLRVATAGHPPPLLATHGHAQALDDVPDVPLGAGMRPRRQTEHALPSDSALLLYTDGLVERRDESLQHGLDRLKRSTAQAAPDPEAIVDAVLDAARLTQTAGDDVAILVVAFA